MMQHEIAYTPKRRASFFLIVLFVALPSDILRFYLAVPLNIAFLVLVAFGALLFLSRGTEVKEHYILLYCSIIFIGSLASYFSMQLTQLMITIAFVASVFVSSNVCYKSLNRRGAHLLVSISIAISGGAAAGLFVSNSGFAPLFRIDPGGLELSFFISTFAIELWNGFVRPTGIFDEPGSLAMFSIFCSIIGISMGVSQKLIDINMALLPLSTSLAGILIFFLYVVFRLTLTLTVKYLMLGCITTLLFMIALPDVLDLFFAISDKFFISRLEVAGNGLAGDNRTTQLINFFQVADWNIVLRGATENQSLLAGDQAAHPLSPMFHHGGFIWLLYAVFCGGLVISAMKTHGLLRFSYLALLLLLLQRPYVTNIEWSIPLLVTFFSLRRCCLDSPGVNRYEFRTKVKCSHRGG